jgi:hypothetical protein
MGLFDHFRKKKTGPAEEQTAGVLKPEQEDGKQNVEASEPEQKQEAEVTRPVEKQTAAVPESTSEQTAAAASGAAAKQAPEEAAPEREQAPEEAAPEREQEAEAPEPAQKQEAEASEAAQKTEGTASENEQPQAAPKSSQRLGVTAIFRVDTAFAMDHDGTPATLVSGFLEMGTISVGDSLVLTDANNGVRATFPVSGLERLGRDPLPKITFEEGGANQNAYAIYVNNTAPETFHPGDKCYRIEQNRGRNNPDRVSEKRAAQLAGILRAGILDEGTLGKLTIQELCFMIRMIRQIHEQNEVNDFENKESALEKELCRKVYEADELFVMMDRTTNMPFLDQGAVDIYSKESFARDAMDFYRRQFRQLAVLRYEKKASPFPDKMSLFRYLYYTGVNLVTVDNGQFKVTLDRDEIEKDPGLNELNRLPFKVTNPALRFALNSLLSEARWPVKYAQHEQNVKLREVRMLDQLDKAILLLPVRAEGHRLTGLVTYHSLPRNAKIQIPHITDKKQQHFLPFFTDPFEFQRVYPAKEWAALPCDIKHALMMDPRIGLIINPVAENFVLTVDGKKSLIAAFAQREKQLKAEEEAGTKAGVQAPEKPDIGPGPSDAG